MSSPPEQAETIYFGAVAVEVDPGRQNTPATVGVAPSDGRPAALVNYRA